MNESQADFWILPPGRVDAAPGQGARPFASPVNVETAAPQTRFTVTRIDAVTPLDDQLGIDPKRGWPAPLDPFFGSDQGRHCYVLLDAAEGDGLTELMEGSGLEHACLYQGAALYELGDVAPWLARLEPDSSFARMLMTRGRSPASLWGRFGGLYLRTDATLGDLRAHLRRRLRVQDAEGKAYHLRFWDSRLIAELARLQGDSADILRALFDGRDLRIDALARDIGDGDFAVIARDPDGAAGMAAPVPATASRADLTLPAVLRAVRASAQATCIQVVTHGLMQSIPRHLAMLDVGRGEVERLVLQVAADARGFGVTGRAAIAKLAAASAFLGYRMLYDPRLSRLCAPWLPVRAPLSDVAAVTRMMEGVAEWRVVAGLAGNLAEPLAAIGLTGPDLGGRDGAPQRIRSALSPESARDWAGIVAGEARRAGLRHPAALAAHDAVALICGPFFLTDPLQGRLAACFLPDADPRPGLLAEARRRMTMGADDAA